MLENLLKDGPRYLRHTAASVLLEFAIQGESIKAVTQQCLHIFQADLRPAIAPIIWTFLGLLKGDDPDSGEVAAFALHQLSDHGGFSRVVPLRKVEVYIEQG